MPNHASSTGLAACLFVCLLHHGLAVFSLAQTFLRFRLPSLWLQMGSLGTEYNESLVEERKLRDLIQYSIGAQWELTVNDIAQCKKECGLMHDNDFEILRKRLVHCEEELQKAKTDNAAIKINEKDLMELIFELTNRVSALEAQGKKKDERLERLEDEQIAKIWASGADCASGADICISLGCNFPKHPQGFILNFPEHCCRDCKSHGVKFHGKRCQGEEELQ